MHKLIITLLVLLLINLDPSVQAAPTQIVPCDFIYKLSPIIKIYHNHLNNHFETNGGLEKLDIDFVMYILPSFENESAIVSYKSSEGNHVLELLTSQDSVWYLLNNYAETNSIQPYDVPQNANINFPKILSTSKKLISEKTAHQLKEAVDFSVRQRKHDPKEFEDYGGYLDGTSIYFLTSKNECGQPFVGSAPGPAKQILILSEFLEYFMQDKVSEASLVITSKTVLN